MRRFRELVDDIRETHPTDDFFPDLNNWLRREPIRKSHYESYDRALQVLDHNSWTVLKAKAVQQFRNERPGQRKQAFFNTLNEAFAYRYLLRKGYGEVRFVKEGKKTSPDIRFVDSGQQKYCEVKTLGISDAEAARREGRRVYDRSVYDALGETFFKKLAQHVGEARAQIHGWGNDGVVFVVLRFDNLFYLEHYGNYRQQLVRFCRTRGFKQLVLKIDHRANRILRFE